MTDVARIASRRRTPYYLFDGGRLRRDAETWQRASRQGGVRLFYPYKTNRHPAVLDLLAGMDIGAEVATASDFRRARRRGLGGDRIVIHGPAKERELIDGGLGARATFVADGSEDAASILDRAAGLRLQPLYLLRLSVPSAEASQAAYGFSPRALLEFVRRCRFDKRPVPMGVAFHLGTGLSAAGPYRDAIDSVAKCAGELESLGAPLRILDVGGGFAARGESRLDAAGRPRPVPAPPVAVLRAIADSAARRLGASVLVLAEPGRALVSDAFDLVARVVGVKRTAAGADVFLDASRVSHAFFVPRGRHPLTVFPRRPRGRERIRLWGPLGVDLELLMDVAPIGVPRPGDLVVIRSVGAYNANASNAWSGRRAGVERSPASRPRRRRGTGAR